MTLTTLKDFRGDRVDIECQRCARHGSFERKVLVKKFGAAIAFVQLRRILSMGCDRAGTDACEACFPCLLNSQTLTDGGEHAGIER